MKTTLRELKQAVQKINEGRDIPENLKTLRKILKTHSHEYKRIRLINPASELLWDELDNLRMKNINPRLVTKMSPMEARDHALRNPSDIAFLVAGDGSLVGATSTNKWILVPTTEEEATQEPGEKSTLIVYPSKTKGRDLWKTRGSKNDVWTRSRNAYIVNGKILRSMISSKKGGKRK